MFIFRFQTQKFNFFLTFQVINTVGKIFDFFGVKLYRLTKERVYSIFSKESLEEIDAEPNVKLPLDLMIQGLQNDNQLPLFRYVLQMRLTSR